MNSDSNRYLLAIQMRKTGASYSQISLELNIPKSTLSYWFSKTVWSPLVTQTLNLKWGEISKARILAMNSQKKKLLALKYAAIKETAQKEYKILVKNSLFLIGLSLYWGEGDKTANGRVAVINSDPRLLKTIVRFYKQILQVNEDKIRVGMFIYQDHDQENVKKYWSNQLKISENQFIKTQVLPSRSHLTKRKTQYGMCSVYFSSTELSIKIHEWINILAEDMRE